MLSNVVELPEFRDYIHIFRDRVHAGEILSEMLDYYRQSDAIVLAVPSGGVPVASAAACLHEVEYSVIFANIYPFEWLSLISLTEELKSSTMIDMHDFVWY